MTVLLWNALKTASKPNNFDIGSHSSAECGPCSYNVIVVPRHPSFVKPVAGPAADLNLVLLAPAVPAKIASPPHVSYLL